VYPECLKDNVKMNTDSPKTYVKRIWPWILGLCYQE